MISTTLTVVTATPHLNPLPFSPGEGATEDVAAELKMIDDYIHARRRKSGFA